MPATYEPIATTTLGSAASTITFSSIPATYTDLRLVITATASSANFALSLRFNNDSGTNYSLTQISGDGSAAASGRTTDATQIAGNAAGVDTTQPGFYTIDVFSYTGSTNKTVLRTNAEDRNGSGRVSYVVGLWRNTAAINRIDLLMNVFGSVNFNAGTTATLYGIKAA